MDALESLQRNSGRNGSLRRCDVEFCNLVASCATTVADVRFCRDGFAGLNVVRRELDCRIGEGGVAQTISKGIEGRTFEVAVGPVGHGVVVKRGQLIERRVKGNGQTACGIVAAGERVCDGLSARL